MGASIAGPGADNGLTAPIGRAGSAQCYSGAMLTDRPSTVKPRRACKRWLAALAMTGCAAVACAQVQVPGPVGLRIGQDERARGAAVAADPLGQLLVEQGLIKPEPGLMQNIRDSASELVLSAIAFVGVPYRRGGSDDQSGFDCSGFTRFIFERSVRLLLPRRSDEQAQTAVLQTVDRNELKPGDLVFFNTLRRTFSHVGIYIGEDRFIHAPRAGGAVRIEDMRERYWARRFTGARRADADSPAPR